MNAPSGVGWAYRFCCGTNAADLRISLPVAASSTYTNPVLPASTTAFLPPTMAMTRSEEHTSELQSRLHLVCRLLLEKKKTHSHTEQRVAIIFAALLITQRACIAQADVQHPVRPYHNALTILPILRMISQAHKHARAA